MEEFSSQPCHLEVGNLHLIAVENNHSFGFILQSDNTVRQLTLRRRVGSHDQNVPTWLTLHLCACLRYCSEGSRSNYCMWIYRSFCVLVYICRSLSSNNFLENCALVQRVIRLELNFLNLAVKSIKSYQLEQLSTRCSPLLLGTYLIRNASYIPNLLVFLQTMVVFGNYEGMTPIASLMEAPLAEFELPAEIDPDGAAAILYTSGSTGFPKGAVVSYRNMVSQIHTSG